MEPWCVYAQGSQEPFWVMPFLLPPNLWISLSKSYVLLPPFVDKRISTAGIDVEKWAAQVKNSRIVSLSGLCRNFFSHPFPSKLGSRFSQKLEIVARHVYDVWYMQMIAKVQSSQNQLHGRLIMVTIWGADNVFHEHTYVSITTYWPSNVSYYPSLINDFQHLPTVINNHESSPTISSNHPKPSKDEPMTIVVRLRSDPPSPAQLDADGEAWEGGRGRWEPTRPSLVEESTRNG